MDQTADCREYQKKVDKLHLRVFGNGVKGLHKEMENVQEWQKNIDAIVNQLKGFKLLVALASILTAVQIVMKFVRP